MIVSVESAAPVGVVNLILWLEAVVILEEDIVSDALVIAAACAMCANGPISIANIAMINPKLVIVLIFLILIEDYNLISTLVYYIIQLAMLSTI